MNTGKVLSILPDTRSAFIRSDVNSLSASSDKLTEFLVVLWCRSCSPRGIFNIRSWPHFPSCLLLGVGEKVSEVPSCLEICPQGNF